MPTTMFNSLEAGWDNSARRLWTTLASFATQVFGLSVLIAISLLWVEGPQRVRWLQLTAPAAFSPDVETHAPRAHPAAPTVSNRNHEQIVTPPSIPLQIARVNDARSNGESAPAAPDLPGVAISSRAFGSDIAHGIGAGNVVVIPPHPAAAKPLLVSHLAEASLLHRVRPIYPPIARQARVQGTVELRAIISKTGTIDNLVVLRGHPMLASAAVEAVRQWRYRPYLLNSEPVEVETEITVNFTLSGG